MTQVSSLADGIKPGDYVIAMVCGMRAMGQVSLVHGDGTATICVSSSIGGKFAFVVRLIECLVIRVGMTLFYATPRTRTTKMCVVTDLGVDSVRVRLGGDSDSIMMSHAAVAGQLHTTRREARKHLHELLAVGAGRTAVCA